MEWSSISDHFYFVQKMAGTYALDKAEFYQVGESKGLCLRIMKQKRLWQSLQLKAGWGTISEVRKDLGDLRGYRASR